MGVLAGETLHAGEAVRVVPCPLFAFAGERRVMRGSPLGAKIVTAPGFAREAIAAAGRDGALQSRA